jgi:hypothetical protein
MHTDVKFKKSGFKLNYCGRFKIKCITSMLNSLSAIHIKNIVEQFEALSWRSD